MERETIRQLFGDNFMGLEEVGQLMNHLGFNGKTLRVTPIGNKYCLAQLERAATNNYILIWYQKSIEGQELSLRYLRDRFGVDPDKAEPCFYNQDWYIKEQFMDNTLKSDWYLIKKDVIEESRAMQPDNLRNKGVIFPPAILCAYTFFAYYYARKEYLWHHDFVWCADKDHNGDQIYVGKYHDIDGINRNGFSIHRHLALRPCYGSINYI